MITMNDDDVDEEEDEDERFKCTQLPVLIVYNVCVCVWFGVKSVSISEETHKNTRDDDDDSKDVNDVRAQKKGKRESK